MLALAAAGAVLLAGPAPAQEQTAPNQEKEKTFRIERAMPQKAVACIECHKRESPGIFADWASSRHAHANITCLDCHQAEDTDRDVAKDHFKQYERTDTKWGAAKYRATIATAVTPKDCSRCHPTEAKQYDKSKHAHTLEIIWKLDPWLNAGLNSDFERANGCFHCHGTVLEIDQEGKLDPLTWPNVGVGRLNLDGSLGSCSACHTRHRFSVAEARKPDTCGQCHLGPDHPQIEIWNESKHGAIYRSFGEKWNWDAAPGTWTAGVDYRTPTCAACHMSGSGEVLTTHDVTERISWETQAPLTIRPSEFKPWPSPLNWQTEREKMQKVCQQCHSEDWVLAHYRQLDKAVELYNETYFKPAKAKLDKLYAQGLMPQDAYFQAPLWTEFYELWHHEGRRARMGAAMMAPDYAWWHGFYECKKRFVEFMHRADQHLESGEKVFVSEDFPAATGDTTRPPQIFGGKQ
jgi:hypothetical protein